MTAVAKRGFPYKPEESEAANKVGVAAASRFRRMCYPVGGESALGDGGLVFAPGSIENRSRLRRSVPLPWDGPVLRCGIASFYCRTIPCCHEPPQKRRNPPP